MASRKKKGRKPKEEYNLISIKVSEYRVQVYSGINHDVRVPRYYHPHAKVYEFVSMQVPGTKLT